MKKILVAVAAFAFLSQVSFAAEGQAPVAQKIGVIKIEQVFKEYKFAKEMETSIKKEFENDEKEMKDLDAQIRDKMDKLRNNPLIRPGGKSFKLGMLEIERLKIELDDKRATFKKESGKRMAESYKAIYEDFRLAVTNFAKHNKFDLVITAPDPELGTEDDSANPQAIINEIVLRRVQFVSENVDITKYIVDYMNQIYASKKKGVN
ncbi:MAG: OmpH family outer membrane protein [Planctomycetes bacterium]|nr:OmpH family outer membrane protein [Planctomycetota bacterium]